MIREQKIVKGMICKGCGRNTSALNEYCYVVHDEIWLKVCGDIKKGFLCIGCLETRLGRELTPKDFTIAPINDPLLFADYKSEQLKERQRGKATLPDACS